MTKPRLYGIAGSRAFRSIWAAEEIGLDYEHVPTSFREDSKAPEYLAVNPNGRIPALEDGDLKLFESMAINMYLAEQYGPALLPSDPQGKAQVWQWSVWGISEIEPLQMQIVIQAFFVPEDSKEPAVVEQATQGLARPLGVLEQRLADHDFLLGDAFTLADLNLAAVMDLLSMIDFDLAAWPQVQAWLDRCRQRPSYAAAKAVGS